jgi:predicted PurR-regulated permease PerM
VRPAGARPRGPAPPSGPAEPAPASPGGTAGQAEQRAIRFSPTAKTITLLVMATTVVVFLAAVRGVLTPFVVAAVVAYASNPIINWLVARTRLKRIWCVVLPYLLGWGLVILALTRYIPILNEETQQLANSITVLIPDLYQRYANNMQQFNLFGVTINVQQQVAAAAAGFADLTRSLGRQTVSFAGGLLDTVTQLFTFNIALFYLLLDGRRLAPFLRDRLPVHYRGEVLGLSLKVDNVLGRYLRAQLLLISIMAVASFIALTILDVRFSVVLALAAGFLEIFPIIGPTAAISLVSLVALVQHDNRFGLPQVSFVIIVALVFFIMRQIEDYLVIPNIVGHVVQLHPVVILFALFCGGAIAGVLGMFLAVPLTGALRILIGYLYRKLVDA